MHEPSPASRALRLPALFLAVAVLSTVTACEAEVITMVEVDVEILPRSITLTEGDSATASAVIRERGGVALSGLSVTWAIDNPAVATVTAEGVVQGRGAGTTVLRASSGGASGSAQVRVWGLPNRDEDDRDCFLCLF